MSVARRFVTNTVLLGDVDPIDSDNPGALTNIDELIHRLMVTTETWVVELEQQYPPHKIMNWRRAVRNRIAFNLEIRVGATGTPCALDVDAKTVVVPGRARSELWHAVY